MPPHGPLKPSRLNKISLPWVRHKFLHFGHVYKCNSLANMNHTIKKAQDNRPGLLPAKKLGARSWQEY